MKKTALATATVLLLSWVYQPTSHARIRRAGLTAGFVIGGGWLYDGNPFPEAPNRGFSEGMGVFGFRLGLTFGFIGVLWDNYFAIGQYEGTWLATFHSGLSAQLFMLKFFFVKAGIGWSTTRHSSRSGGVEYASRRHGFGFVAGAGVEFLHYHRFFTAFFEVTALPQIYAGAEGGSANTLMAGVGCQWY